MAKAQNPVVKVYVILYNLLQAAGWYYIAYLSVLHFANGGTLNNLWATTQQYVYTMQLIATLELFHVMFGLVAGGVGATFGQLLGRGGCLFLVLNVVAEVQTLAAAGCVVLTWTSIELVRYPFYLFQLLNLPSGLLLWLRYTLFIPLYPVGAASEMIVIYYSLPVIHNYWAPLTMPNSFNFAFDIYYWLCLTLALYAPMFPQQYMYMVAQRKKKLGAPKKKAQ